MDEDPAVLFGAERRPGAVGRSSADWPRRSPTATRSRGRWTQARRKVHARELRWCPARGRFSLAGIRLGESRDIRNGGHAVRPPADARRSPAFSRRSGCKSATPFYGKGGRSRHGHGSGWHESSRLWGRSTPWGNIRDEFADARRLRGVSSKYRARLREFAGRPGRMPVLWFPDGSPAQRHGLERRRDPGAKGRRGIARRRHARDRSTGPRRGTGARWDRSGGST